MDIRIMGLRRAMAHVPQVPTLALRIFNSYEGCETNETAPLVDSPHYTICAYTFDEQNPDYLRECDRSYDLEGLRRRNRIFDAAIAEQILRDFEQHKEGKLELLVHCLLGVERSPAVAIALNEVFALGGDGRALRERYLDHNTYICRTLIATARLHGFPHQRQPEDL